MDKIDSIVFDLGGVLLSNDDKGIVGDSEELQKILNKNKDELEKAWDIAWPDFRDGNITEQEFYTIFLKNFNKEVGDKEIKMIRNIYRKNTSTLEPYNLLKVLVNKYKLYTLTNIGKEGLKYKTKKFNLDKYFTGIIASCLEGIGKPNREIFERLIKRYSINPQKALFIDDKERNTKVAEGFGFRVILYKNKNELINDFRKFGIEI